MQLINSALLAALLASVAEGAMEFFYTTTQSLDQVVAIATADSQLILIKNMFKKNSKVRPVVADYITLFQSSVKDGSFTWEAYKERLTKFKASLTDDDRSLIESMEQDSNLYNPWEWVGELKDYQWDALNHALERVYRVSVASGESTAASDPVIEERQRLVRKYGAAQALAGGGYKNFFNDLDNEDGYMGTTARRFSMTYAEDLVRDGRYPSEEDLTPAPSTTEPLTFTPPTFDPPETTEPALSSGSGSTTVGPVGTTKAPAPAPSAASLASVSVAVATVALSLVAMFA